MPETRQRWFRILAAAWLGLGVLCFVVVFINLIPLFQGRTPSGLFESGEGWWIVDLVFFGAGALWAVNGLALLRRKPLARPLLVVSSIALLPASGLVVPLVVAVPSLWLTLSTNGKKAFQSYLAEEG